MANPAAAAHSELYVATIPNFTVEPKKPNPVAAGIRRGVSVIADETSDTSSLSNITKLARRTFEILAFCGAIAIAVTPAAKFFKVVADFFKVFSLGKGAKDVVESSDWKKTTQGVCTVAVATMTGMKVAESFNWLSIAEISKSIGRVPVIGVIGYVPFSLVLDLFELLSCSLGIAISAKKLEQINKKMVTVKEKTALWSEREVNPDFFTERVGHYTVKGERLEQAATALEDKIRASGARKTAAGSEYENLKAELDEKLEEIEQQNCIKQLFSKMLLIKDKINVKKKAREYKKITREHALDDAKLLATRDKITKLDSKKDFWEELSNRTDATPITGAERQELDDYLDNKLHKWEFKKANLNLDRLKEGLTIGFNVLIIITVIFSIVITFTGAGAAAIPIAMATLSLAIAAYGIGQSLFKKYKKPLPISAIPLPSWYAAAPAA